MLFHGIDVDVIILSSLSCEHSCKMTQHLSAFACFIASAAMEAWSNCTVQLY